MVLEGSLLLLRSPIDIRSMAVHYGVLGEQGILGEFHFRCAVIADEAPRGL